MAKQRACLGEDLEILVGGLKQSFLAKISNPSRREYIIQRLREYGITRQERVNNMKTHILGCTTCRDRYLRYLDSKAERTIEVSNKTSDSEGGTPAEQLMQSADYLELIEAYDFLRLVPALKEQGEEHA